MMSLFAELKKSIISLDAASLANHCSLNSLLAHKNVFFQYKPVFLLLLFQVVFQQKNRFFLLIKLKWFYIFFRLPDKVFFRFAPQTVESQRISLRDFTLNFTLRHTKVSRSVVGKSRESGSATKKSNRVLKSFSEKTILFSALDSPMFAAILNRENVLVAQYSFGSLSGAPRNVTFLFRFFFRLCRWWWSTERLQWTSHPIFCIRRKTNNSCDHRMPEHDSRDWRGKPGT